LLSIGMVSIFKSVGKGEAAFVAGGNAGLTMHG
jgi:hypothetical protein